MVLKLERSLHAHVQGEEEEEVCFIHGSFRNILSMLSPGIREPSPSLNHSARGQRPLPSSSGESDNIVYVSF